MIAKTAHGGQSKTCDRWSDHKQPQPVIYFALVAEDELYSQMRIKVGITTDLQKQIIFPFMFVQVIILEMRFVHHKKMN